MRIVGRYISNSVVGATAVVLLVIVSLDAISALVDQLGDMRNNYDFWEVLAYVFFTLPSRIYENIPFSALVGCLIGLGVLAGSSELIVMRAAGVSVARITWGVMRPALWFIVLGVVLGEFVTPLTDQIAESRRALALGDTRALESKAGLWNREGDEFMHFNAVQPNGVLYGVTRYRFDPEGKLLASSFSERATYQYRGEHSSFWIEEGVSEAKLDSEQVEKINYSTRRWYNEITPSLLNVLVLPPEALSIRSLWSRSNYLEHQSLVSREYRLAFWQKVLQPLATLSLVLIAVSFVFGPLREVTMGFRIFSGVIVGILFRTSQDLLGPSSLVFGFSPLIAVSIPIAICVLIGLNMLRKV